MNETSLAKLNFARRRFLRSAIPGAVVLVILLGWTCVMLAQQAELREDIADCRNQINAMDRQCEEPDVLSQLLVEQKRNDSLLGEWEQLRMRTDSFARLRPLAASLSVGDEGRIDFKISVIEARERLAERATATGTKLPEDFGLAETIDEGETTKSRLWQAAAAVRVLDHCLGQRVSEIVDVVPLDPFELPLPIEKSEVAYECPIELTMNCTFEEMMAFFVACSENGTFISVRKVWIERAAVSDNPAMTLKATLGCILFAVETGESLYSAEAGA